MKKNNYQESEMIELLEKRLSDKIDVYNSFKSSDRNDRYFNNLYYKTMNNLEEKRSESIFSLKPAIGYAILFIISFTISFQLIDFSGEVSLNEEQFLFSETSLWIEEEIYLSNLSMEELELDFASYINSELNYSSSVSMNYEMNYLSENDFDEIFENLKNKKIL